VIDITLRAVEWALAIAAVALLFVVLSQLFVPVDRWKLIGRIRLRLLHNVFQH